MAYKVKLTEKQRKELILWSSTEQNRRDSSQHPQQLATGINLYQITNRNSDSY